MLNVSKTDLWSAPVDDKPGGVVARIEDLVLKGDLNLEFLLAQRATEPGGSGSVLLLPIRGERQESIAAKLGFVRNPNVFGLRVSGEDEPGIAYRLLKALADRGINLRAVSATAIGDRFVMYVGLDTPADAEIATKILMAPV